jgi:hypothetical protein
MNPEETRNPPASPAPATTASAQGYEPPCIERVLMSDDLDREVQFAGTFSGDTTDS